MYHRQDAMNQKEKCSAQQSQHPTAPPADCCHCKTQLSRYVLAQCSARPIWRKQLIVRCGNVRRTKGPHPHDVAIAHYDHHLSVKDVATSETARGHGR